MYKRQYSYNHKASRLKGQRGAVMPGDATRNLGSYFVDFILEYRGFAFYTDFMGRSCSDPLFSPETGAFVYNGQGLNVQTSYLFNKKWEIALRNSTLFPDSEVQPLAGYRNWNQMCIRDRFQVYKSTLPPLIGQGFFDANDALFLKTV